MTRALDFPASRRNRDPILRVLKEQLPLSGSLLEIAAGSGQHAVAFAAHLPQWTWTPTDLDPLHVDSINAWRAQVGTNNCQEAQQLDVHGLPGELRDFDAVFCANMIHIAPWSAALSLLRGASATLRRGGLLLLYGPFIQPGVETAPSNLAFDADLRSRDPSWGVRDLAVLEREAADVGFSLRSVVPMPANNLTVVFQLEASRA